MQCPTDLRGAQCHGHHFLRFVVPMDTNLLAADTVELSPLQGRVEETLPDKSMVGVVVKDTWLCKPTVKQNLLWGVGLREGDRVVELTSRRLTKAQSKRQLDALNLQMSLPSCTV